MRRWIARKKEPAECSFVTKKESSAASRYGHLVGLGQLATPRHVEILPYSLAKASYRPVAAGDPFQDGSDQVGSLGADLKYGLTRNLTPEGTANPDLGQVEVDPAVVNLSAVETFFPERRPFFIEGADLFRFGQSRSQNSFNTTIPFHARRIGRSPQLLLQGGGFNFVDAPSVTTIDAALKLTGKTPSGWSVGVLDAVTSRERARYLDDVGLMHRVPVEPLTNYFVGRLRRESGGGNTSVGLLGTAVVRDGSDSTLASMLRSRAFAGGVDFNRYWANRNWSLDGYVLGSYVRGSAGAIDRRPRSGVRDYQRPDADHLRYDPTRPFLPA